jgi:5-methylcytosine-specific restriction endonuclease McrA
MKICTSCKLLKEFAVFGKHHLSKDGYRHVCKDCRSKDAKTLRKKNTKVKTREQLNRLRLKKEDPIKLRSRELRQSFRKRSDLAVPQSVEIEQWIKNQLPLTCWYTGEKLKPTSFSIDHKIPVSRGGTNNFDNLCVCSLHVNNAKGSMSEEEFIELLEVISTWEDKGVVLLRRLRASNNMYKR